MRARRGGSATGGPIAAGRFELYGHDVPGYAEPAPGTRNHGPNGTARALGGAHRMVVFDNSLGGSRASGLGHWGAQILIGAIVAAIALVVRPLPPQNPLAVVVPTGLFLVVIASWLLMRRHDRRLCETCMAAMPLNPAELSVRYRRRFAVAHLAANRPLVIGYLLALVASNFVLLDSSLLPPTPARYVWAILQTTMIYLILASSTHRRLQPWCPQCQDGGGEGEEAAAPDPVPTGYQHA